jgi:hypothetical protein
MTATAGKRPRSVTTAVFRALGYSVLAGGFVNAIFAVEGQYNVWS